MTINELKQFLSDELKTCQVHVQLTEDKISDPDYEGDWGSDNETLGYFTGRVDLINSILTQIK